MTAGRCALCTEELNPTPQVTQGCVYGDAPSPSLCARCLPPLLEWRSFQARSRLAQHRSRVLRRCVLCAAELHPAPQGHNSQDCDASGAPPSLCARCLPPLLEWRSFQARSRLAQHRFREILGVPPSSGLIQDSSPPAPPFDSQVLQHSPAHSSGFVQDSSPSTTPCDSPVLQHSPAHSSVQPSAPCLPVSSANPGSPKLIGCSTKKIDQEGTQENTNTLTITLQRSVEEHNQLKQSHPHDPPHHSILNTKQSENSVSFSKEKSQIPDFIPSNFDKETQVPLSKENSPPIYNLENFNSLDERQHFSCPECCKSFPDKSKLTMHLLTTHSNVKRHLCTVCRKVFINDSDLKEHQLTHTRDSSSKLCKICNKTLSSASSLNIHLLQVHGNDRPYTCKICDKHFKQKVHLKVHLEMYYNIKPYSCSVCEKRFTRKADLKIHILTHTDEKTVICPECDKAFKSHMHLQRHMIVHSDKKRFACTFCDKYFRHSNTLKCHLATHKDEKPYSCNECGKTFKIATGLRSHKMSHITEKKFKCTRCEKLFTRLGLLRNHLARHDKNRPKPHSCPVCAKCFADRGDMRKHTRTHSKERPFSCTKCPDTFRLAKFLQSHVETVHFGYRPFECDICAATMSQKVNLRKHIQIVHLKQRPYKCEFCNERFTYKRRVFSHVKNCKYAQ